MSAPLAAPDDGEADLPAHYEDLATRLQSTMEAAAAAPAEWPEKVWDALAASLDFLAADPAAARLLCVEAALGGPVGLARHQASVAALATALRSGRDRYPKAEVLPAATERILVAGAIAAISARLLAGNGADLAALGPDLAETMLAPYVDPPRWRRTVREGAKHRALLRELSETSDTYRPLPSGPRHIPAEQVASDQRQRVLRSLAEGLALSGYGALTVDWIVTRARISKRTFYELFGDKRSCVLAAYEDAERRLWERGSAAAAAESDWAAQMIAALGAVLAFFAAEPATVHLFAGEGEVADPEVAARHRQVEERLVVLLGGARQAYPSKEELPQVAEAALLENLTAVIASYVLRGEAERLPALASELGEMVLTSYMGAADAERLVCLQRCRRSIPHRSLGDGQSGGGSDQARETA